MSTDMPADPQKEVPATREVSPVTFFTPHSEPAEIPGLVHPSESITHRFEINRPEAEEIVHVTGLEDIEPTESDREQSLLEADENALKGTAVAP